MGGPESFKETLHGCHQHVLTQGQGFLEGGYLAPLTEGENEVRDTGLGIFPDQCDPEIA